MKYINITESEAIGINKLAYLSDIYYTKMQIYPDNQEFISNYYIYTYALELFSKKLRMKYDININSYIKVDEDNLRLYIIYDEDN